MVGVNVGVPAPTAMFAFTRWSDSFHGDNSQAFSWKILRTLVVAESACQILFAPKNFQRIGALE
jgi:hypothetical protein